MRGDCLAVPDSETEAVRHTGARGRKRLLSQFRWSGCALALSTMRVGATGNESAPRQDLSRSAELMAAAELVQAVPNSTFCSDQVFGSGLVSAMRFAVSSKGWRSLRMAETILGARKLSLRMRVK